MGCQPSSQSGNLPYKHMMSQPGLSDIRSWLYDLMVNSIFTHFDMKLGFSCFLQRVFTAIMTPAQHLYQIALVSVHWYEGVLDCQF